MKKLFKNKMFWMMSIMTILVIALIINSQIYQEKYISIGTY